MTRIVLLTIKNSLVVLFLGMVSFASAQHSAKGDSCMNYILEQDEILGEKRNHACEKISLSQTIEEYVQALESLNYDDCPEDFTLAFMDHLQAWRGLTRVTDNYEEWRGEMHILFDSLATTPDSLDFQSGVDDIWSTWEKIELYAKVKD